MPEGKEWRSQISHTPMFQAFYSLPPTTCEVEMFCMSPVGASSADFELIDSGNCEWVTPNRQVSRMLVDLFRQIEKVHSICAEFSVGGIRVWTLLEGYDREARERVYKKEIEICETLGIRDFDFRVTSVDLVSPEELEQAGCRVIYRRH
jgi:hypothetical protein